MDNTSNRIDFPKIADMYSTALLPPPYYNLHFKFITHRYFINTWQLEEHAKMGCRLGCGCTRETVEHWGTCPKLDHLRERLAGITEEPRFLRVTKEGLYKGQTPYQNRLTFLIGDVPTGKLEKGTANLWLTLWHTLLLSMINKTAEGVDCDIEAVWKLTIQKFATLALAKAYEATKVINTATSRGETPPSEFPNISRLLSPIGKIAPDGHVQWSTRFETELKRLDLPGYVPGGV